MKKILILLLLLILGFFLSFAYLYYKDINTNLELMGEAFITIEYGDEYLEENANVIYKDKIIEVLETKDTVDINKLNTYTLNYNYKSLLSEKSISRTVEIIDTIKPKIELVGDSEINLKLNEKYNELNALASDNYDGDISDKINIIGSVDTSVVGVYKLIYEVYDSSNNKNEIERLVNVYKPVEVKPKNEDINKVGVIYLTFDDGPNEGTTNKILDILKSENVKATFFVTGHAIALHTYSHNYASVYSSIDNYYADLNQISSRVYNTVGIRSKIIRFPGGSSNTISKRYTPNIMSYLVNDVVSKGYIYHDWNVDSNDAGGSNTASAVYLNVINNLSKNRINNVLLHDTHNHTVNALKDIITYAKNNGYTFLIIDENSPAIHHPVHN